MKRLFAAFVCFLFIAAIFPNSARASHAAGGEIAYEWLADSTYRIYFKFYTDCSSAVGEPSTVDLCYKNTCNAQGGNLTLSKILKLPDSTVNGSPVSRGCPPNGTKCTNSSSTVSGYKEWWYTNTVTLPSRCNLWTFSVVISARNSSMNIVGQPNFYVEATLNNVVAQGNSSPFFSVKPVPSVCINQSYTYNNGGVDPNSDSLVFEIDTPLSANTGCPHSPSNVSRPSASPSFNYTNNPIQTGNSFTLSNSTGQMTFTPTLVGAGTITLRAKEYRNGILIGSVMRDVQVQVIACSVASPIVNTVSGSITGATYTNGRVEACAGVPLSFCFDLKSASSTAILVASDNHAVAAPGSAVNYIGQRTDSIRGCLTWTPGTLDTGLRVFSVTAKDSTCVSPGISISQTFVLPIYIWPVTDIIKDTAICLGDSVQLLAVGGSVFTWAVLSGGSPLSTLSCTTCKQPYAKPTMFTQYTVTNSGASFCSKNKDTVSINVLDYSAVVPVASSNSPVCSGNTINLTSTAMAGFSYYWTGPLSFTSNTASQTATRTNSLTTYSGNYIIRGKKNNCYTSADTVTVTVTQSPAAPVAGNNGPLCSGATLNLSASTVTGATYNWTGPATFTTTTQNPVIPAIDTSRKGVYTVTALKDGCTSAPATTTVVVNQTPEIDTSYFNHPTACGGTTGSITLTGLLINTNYTLNYKKDGVPRFPLSTSSNGSGNLVINGLTQGVYSQVTVTINGCTSDTIAPITLIDPAPPVITIATSSNPATCLGSDGTIVIGGLTAAVTYTVNYKKNSVAQSPLSRLASGSGQVTINNLTAGTYDSIKVTLNNCVSNSVGPVTLTDPLPPTISAGSNSPICQGDTMKLTATGPAGTTYSWTGPNSYTAAIQNPYTLNAATSLSGTYEVIGTRANCVSQPSSTIVVVNPIPSSPVAANNGPLCSGDTLHLTATSVTNATYSWTGPVSFTASTKDASRYDVDTAHKGDYAIVAIVNGCHSVPAVTEVIIYQVPAIDSAIFSNPITCLGNDGNIILQGLIPNTLYSVNYKKNGVPQGPLDIATNGVGKLTISGLTQGTYTQITITLNGCTSDTLAPIILADPTPPVISITAYSNPTTCLGSNGTITIGGLTAGVTYTLNYKKNAVAQSPQPKLASASGTVQITALTAGTYDSIKLTVNNCTTNVLGPRTLADPLPPVIVAGNNTPVCQGDTIKLTGTGPVGTIYTWTGPNSFASAAKDTFIANSAPLHSGIYTLVGILNNCTSLPSETTVTVRPTPTTPVAGNNGPLCSGSTLNLTSSTVTGATYGWTGPNTFTATTQNPSRLNVDVPDSGTYRVIATINGCPSLPATTQVTIYHTPHIDTYIVSQPTTCLGADGFIRLQGLEANTTYALNYTKNGTPQATSSVSSNASGFLLLSGLTAGTYTDIHLTLNNCVSATVVPIVLADPIPPIISGDTASSPTTCLGTEGFIILHGLAASATFTVDYTKDGIGQTPLTLSANGAGDITIASLSAGIYDNIKVTINNCSSAEVGPDTLVDPLPPVVSASNNTPICEDDTLRLFANSTPGVVYSWTGPNAYSTSVKDTVIINAQPVLSGEYAVTATINNCTSEPDTTVVIVHPTPPLPNAANDGPYCTGNTLFLSADTIPGATYSWTGPLLFTGSGQYPTITNVTVANLGTYYVTATVFGCISPLDSTWVAIYPPLAPVVGSSTIVHPTTCGGTQGSISLSGLIPDSTYVVTFTKNGIPQTPLNLTATPVVGKITIPNLGQGTYSNIKARLNICASDPIGPLVLNDPLPPVLVVSNNTPLCQTDTIKLFASGGAGVTYSWTGPNGFVSAASDTFIAGADSLLHTGIYEVTGTLYNCTSNPYPTNVIVHPTPATPVAANNGPLCPTTTLQLTATPVTNASYSWRGPNAYTSGNQSPAINNVTPTISGDYVVYVTVSGCRSDSDTTTVLVNPTPVIGSFSVSHPTTCAGVNGSVTLSGLAVNTNYTVNFKRNGIGQTPQNLLSDGIGNIIISGLNQGLYTQIRVTLNNCVSDTLPQVYLYDPTPPVISASNNTPICQGDTIKLSAFGPAGVVYTWTGPASFTASSKDTFIANAQSAQGGIYSLSGILNNCVSTPATTTVIVKPLPLKPNAGNNGPLCEGTTLSLTASTLPTATYRWAGPNAYTSTSQNPLIPNSIPTNSGKYWVSAIVNGCTSIADTTVVVVNANPLAPSVTTPVLYCQFDLTTPLTAGGQNLKWYTVANGGVGNATAPTPSSALPATTTWWVTQTDVNGCEGARSSIVVKVNQKPPKPLVSPPAFYCQFETTVPLNASGTNLKWYTQATGGSFVTTNPLPSSQIWGTFNWWVSMTDGNGCESDREIVTVNIKPKPAPPGVTALSYCDGVAAKNLTAVGQNLHWYTQATGGTGSVNAPVPATADTGTKDYYVSQTIDGCESDRAKLTVIVNPHVTAHIIIDVDTICQHDTLMVYNSGINPASAGYTWEFDGADIITGNPGEGPYTIKWLTTGAKTITITVSNLNCTATDTKIIPVREAPVADFQLNDNACIGEILELRPYQDYTLQYNWTFNDAIIKDTSKYRTYDLYWTTPGDKKITLVTVAPNGCRSKPHEHITVVHYNTTPTRINISRDGICTGDTIQLSAVASGMYTYKWSPAEYFYNNNYGEYVTGRIARTGYVGVRTIDPYGCNREDSIMINTIPCCEAYLPNAFTPNNDGLNDRFKIITIGHHRIAYFIIVNRWGQEVFRTNDETDGWDGTFRGVPQDIGTYNYYIQYQCSNGKIYEMKGELALIK